MFNVGLIASTVLTMLVSSLWPPQGIAGWVTIGTAVRPALLLAGFLTLLVLVFYLLAKAMKKQNSWIFLSAVRSKMDIMIGLILWICVLWPEICLIMLSRQN